MILSSAGFEDGGGSALAGCTVAVGRLETPIGELLLAATDRGLVRVAFAMEDFDSVQEELRIQLGAELHANAAPLEERMRELREYFAGDRRTFDAPVDLRLARRFRRDVLERLREVGYGEVTTYAALARSAGRPRATRAVGSACASNPLPIVVPCHRVLRSDGGLGGYLAGPEVKRTLLALEQPS